MRTKILVILGAVVAVAAIASGQAQRGPATLDDLLAEIRGLRADLRQTTRASTQMQVLTARLQLQEQRIAVLANQRADVTARLAVQTPLRVETEAQVRNFEGMISRNESLEVPRAELTVMLAERQRALSQHRNAEQQLRTQESDLSAQIAAEQNRWQDFNNRLDELERSLK